jgi:hypothetical protein
LSDSARQSPSTMLLLGSAEAADIRADPVYAEGFEDAKGGDPLFADASPAYAAGWQAYWNIREALKGAA